MSRTTISAPMADYLVAVLAGITVTAVGGLAFVAYRHPARYRKLASPLAILCNLAICGVVLWDMSNNEVYSAVAKFELLGEKYKEVAGIISGLQISPWWILGCLLLQVYILLLLQLRNWLPDEPPPVRVNADSPSPNRDGSTDQVR